MRLSARRSLPDHPGVDALLCALMSAEPVELTKRERRIVTGSLIVFVVGEVVLRVVGNTTDVWWPSFALLGAFLVFAVGFALNLSRTRDRSLGSLLALALPDRLRGRPE